MEGAKSRTEAGGECGECGGYGIGASHAGELSALEFLLDAGGFARGTGYSTEIWGPRDGIPGAALALRPGVGCCLVGEVRWDF
jgi:hypothetical protein